MRHIKYLTKNPKKKEEIFRLIIRPDFDEAVSIIRKKWDIDIHEPLSEKDYISLMENVQLALDVKELMKKFKLPERLLDLLHGYIVVNDFVPSGNTDPEGLSLEIHFDNEAEFSTGEPRYFLRLSKNTTLLDIKRAWPKIQKELRSDKKTKNRPWGKFWRDYEIYKLSTNGKTIEEIACFIKEKFKEDLDFGNIKKIESTFRKKIGMPKKNKLKMTSKKLRL